MGGNPCKKKGINVAEKPEGQEAEQNRNNKTGSWLQRARNQECGKWWDKKQEGKAQTILVCLSIDSNCQKDLAQGAAQTQNFPEN